MFLEACAKAVRFAARRNIALPPKMRGDVPNRLRLRHPEGVVHSRDRGASEAEDAVANVLAVGPTSRGRRASRFEEKEVRLASDVLSHCEEQLLERLGSGTVAR